MKYEIELNSFHSSLLKKISAYTEIDETKLIKSLVINHIEKFDSDMQEFIESTMCDEVYDDYIGRYID